MTLVENIGLNLKRLRKERGFSNKEIAIQLDMSEKYLSTVELGKKIPSVRLLVKYANLYGVGIDDLLSERKDVDVKLDQQKRIYTNLIAANSQDLDYIYSLALRVKNM